ncbi:MAG: hypothetical protein IKS37_02995 [Solobacterium sp.]|nr:hypothetical protein [Solobacterium sp.]
MEREPLSLLSQSSIQNDIALPIWVYAVEKVVVKAKRYLKIYLMDRTGSRDEINRITFVHNGKDYEGTDFRPVSKYSSDNYKGCVIEVELDDSSDDLSIQQEIVNGQIYEASGKLVRFELPDANAERFQYLRKKKSIEFYPEIREDYWFCTCGRIHAPYETTCRCGRTIEFAQEILSLDLNKAYIQDYVADGWSFDLERSFDDNLNSYIDAFVQKHPSIPKADLLVAMDLEQEKNRYQSELDVHQEQKRIKAEEEVQASKKHKKQLLAGALAAVFVAVLILVFTVILPKKNYNDAITYLHNNEIEHAYEKFKKTHVKDSDIYVQAMDLINESVYDRAIEVLKTASNQDDSDYILNYAYNSILNDLSEGKSDVSGYTLLPSEFVSANAEKIYQIADSLIDKKSYDQAKILFEYIPNYNNSKELSTYCHAAVNEQEGKLLEAINDWYSIKGVLDSSQKLNAAVHTILFESDLGYNLDDSMRIMNMMDTWPEDIRKLYELCNNLKYYAGDYKTYKISKNTPSGRSYSSGSKEKTLKFTVKKGYVYCLLNGSSLGVIQPTSEQTPFSSSFSFYDYYDYKYGTAGNSEGVLVIDKAGDEEVVWCPTYYGPDSGDYLTQTFYMKKK